MQCQPSIREQQAKGVKQSPTSNNPPEKTPITDPIVPQLTASVSVIGGETTCCQICSTFDRVVSTYSSKDLLAVSGVGIPGANGGA